MPSRFQRLQYTDLSAFIKYEGPKARQHTSPGEALGNISGTMARAESPIHRRLLLGAAPVFGEPVFVALHIDFSPTEYDPLLFQQLPLPLRRFALQEYFSSMSYDALPGKIDCREIPESPGHLPRLSGVAGSAGYFAIGRHFTLRYPPDRPLDVIEIPHRPSRSLKVINGFQLPDSPVWYHGYQIERENSMGQKGGFKNQKLGKIVHRQVKRRGAPDPVPSRRQAPPQPAKRSAV
jgi:hypothetical protein